MPVLRMRVKKNKKARRASSDEEHTFCDTRGITILYARRILKSLYTDGGRRWATTGFCCVRYASLLPARICAPTRAFVSHLQVRRRKKKVNNRKGQTDSCRSEEQSFPVVGASFLGK